MKNMSLASLSNPASQVLTISRFEMLKHFRAKKVFGLLALAVGLAIFVIAIPELFDVDRPESERAFIGSSLDALGFLLVITAVLFGSNALSSEFHDRTGFALFPNPVSKWTIWLGKFLGAELTSFAIIGIYYGIIISATFSIYETVPIEVYISVVFSLFVTTMIMSFAFFLSSIINGPTSSAVFVFFLFILILPMIDAFLINLPEVKPWYSPTFSDGIIANILTVPYPSDLEPGALPRGPFDHERFVPYIFQSIVVLSIYTISFGLASAILFKRKEM